MVEKTHETSILSLHCVLKERTSQWNLFFELILKNLEENTSHIDMVNYQSDRLFSISDMPDPVQCARLKLVRQRGMSYFIKCKSLVNVSG